VSRRFPTLPGFIGLLSLPAFAAEPPSAFDTRAALDVGVHFSQLKNDLKYPSADSTTRVERLTLSWREKFTDRLLLGMHGGYSYATQNGNPLTEGLELDGYHFGLSASVGLTPPSATLQVVAEVSFTYEQVEHESTSQTVDMDWRESRAGLWVFIPLGPAVQLIGAARYGSTSGEQRASGAVNSTDDFDSRRNGSAVGINASDGRLGSVGIVGYKDLDQGWEVYFKRQF
jgi:hypothetical protein